MPYFYRTGLAESGRSCVLERREISLTSQPFVALTMDEPVVTIPEGDAAVPLLEALTPPGGAFYNLHVWHPGDRTDMHRTISVDFTVVLEGSITMELQDESVELHPGDCVTLPAVAHAWVAGPNGAAVLHNLIAGSPSGGDVGRETGRHDALDP